MSEPTTSAPSKALEAKYKIAFVGTVVDQIVGGKLPSNRQVYELFFHNMRIDRKTARESANLVKDAVIIFWKQARIPTKDPARIVDKIMKMYDKWQKLKKSHTKRGATQIEAERAFNDMLDDLFDIAGEGALENMTNEDDKQFLIRQREKGRPGHWFDANQSGRTQWAGATMQKTISRILSLKQSKWKKTNII